jgi:hypothetical protein
VLGLFSVTYRRLYDNEAMIHLFTYVTDAFLYTNITHDRQKLYHEDMRRTLLDKRAVIMTMIKHAAPRRSDVNQNV